MISKIVHRPPKGRRFTKVATHTCRALRAYGQDHEPEAGVEYSYSSWPCQLEAVAAADRVAKILDLDSA